MAHFVCLIDYTERVYLVESRHWSILGSGAHPKKTEKTHNLSLQAP